MNTTERTCRKCGTPIARGHLSGLCFKCLAQLGFATSQSQDDSSDEAIQAHRFGQYELIEEIGRGGMGVVYKARQTSLNRIVAIKMVLHGPFSSEEFVQRFRIEAQAAAALRHPNIVTIYEVGQHEHRHYFSMEYIEGLSLAEMARPKPFSATRAAELLKALAEAMHYAHQQGVAHRDLKPSNVLVDLRNQPRILDFGLARLLNADTHLTVNGQALGSPNYMAPEQAGGKDRTIGPAPDIYSLGAILYYLLTSRPPFQGETLHEVLRQVQSVDPVPPRRLNPSVPVDLQTICLKCLRKNPSVRYDRAQSLAEDLARFLSHQPIQARPVSHAEQFLLWCVRHPIPSLLSGLLLLAVCFGVSGILWQWRRAEMHARGETRQRQLAEASAEVTRKHLYAADISLASQAFQRGEYGLARRTLTGLQPKTGEEDLRGFEWHYLWNLCRGSELATLTGHTWIVTCTAFSPDGRLLASGSQDGTARIWDVANHKPLATLPASAGAVWSTGFSSDGTWLMTAGNLGGVKFWATNSWKIMASFDGQIASLSQTGSVVAISQSNPLYWESTGQVSLWNFRTGKKLMEFSPVARVPVLSPRNDVLAAAGPTSAVYLWDALTGALFKTLPTKDPVWSIAFSPDGQRLVTAGWSAEPLVWDLRRDGQPVPLKGHLRTVWSAAFSPDGSSISTVSSDQTIRCWNANSYATTSVLRGHENEIWCLAVSPDGQLLATGGKDQTVRLWPAQTRPSLDELPNSSWNRPLFSADSRHLTTRLSTVGEKERREVWDLSKRGPSRKPTEPGPLASVSGANDAPELNTSGPSLEHNSAEGLGRVTTKLEGVSAGPEWFGCSGFSPDFAWFFGVDLGGRIRFWEVSSGRLAAWVDGPKPPVRSTALSPKGTYFALSFERENSIHLYSVQSGRELQMKGHRDFVSGLAFSPDARMLASGSVDGTICLWNCASGALVGSFPGHLQETTDVAFSPDGRTLASLAHKDSIKLWHLATLREMVSIDFPEAGRFLQFAPDGGWLAVTTSHDTVRLFAAPSD